VARDAHREYLARERLARERGFRSYWEQRRAPRVLRRVADFGRLPETALERRVDAAAVIAHARRERISVEQSARELKVQMSVVRWWFPQALGRTHAGRTLPFAADRALRLRPLIAVERGLAFVVVRGSRAADSAADAFDVQWRFLKGEAEVAELDALRGLRIGGYAVETDAGALERQGAIGVDVIEAYRELVP
jgi:hypothetical protein